MPKPDLKPPAFRPRKAPISEITRSRETFSTTFRRIGLKVLLRGLLLAGTGCTVVGFVYDTEDANKENSTDETSGTTIDFPTTDISQTNTSSNLEPNLSSGIVTTSSPIDESSGEVPISTCGDDEFQMGMEDCDMVDGVIVGLEDSNCLTENGFNTGILQCDLGTCQFDKSLCTGLCADGIVTPGEGCDDCNLDNGDGCDSSCQLESCGDGIVNPLEVCDDGNSIEDDGCTSNCILSSCGNGVVDRGEACDPLNDPTCQSNCLPSASQCMVGVK